MESKSRGLKTYLGAKKNGFENNKGLSIDRIDSSKGYFPENCRWSNATVQAQNTRRNVLTMEKAKEMRKDAKTMKYYELANKYDVSLPTVYNVIQNKSWKE